MADLSLHAITAGYAPPVLFDNLSVCFSAGSFNVMTGGSGGGKTSLLRVIAGLLQPSSGTIRHGDRVLNHVTPDRRGIAMMFQNQALYPHLTVRQNIATGLSRSVIGQRTRRDRKRVAGEWADRLRISDTLDRRPEQISGGQRRRAALAKCLCSSQPIRLLDEPVSQLDDSLATEFAELIAEHHREVSGITICVTHQLKHFESWADHIHQMRGGVLSLSELSSLDVRLDQ